MHRLCRIMKLIVIKQYLRIGVCRIGLYDVIFARCFKQADRFGEVFLFVCKV